MKKTEEKSYYSSIGQLVCNALLEIQASCPNQDGGTFCPRKACCFPCDSKENDRQGPVFNFYAERHVCLLEALNEGNLDVAKIRASEEYICCMRCFCTAIANDFDKYVRVRKSMSYEEWKRWEKKVTSSLPKGSNAKDVLKKHREAYIGLQMAHKRRF